MTLAISSTGTALAIIGLFVGLIVLGVVIWLLHSTLAPLRAVLSELTSAKTAPMLERGVPGTDQLGTTRRLADSVPPLALAYLQKLSLAPAPAPAAAPAAPQRFGGPSSPPARGPGGMWAPTGQPADAHLPGRGR
ncbi:MAG: hypothetical protein ACRDMZ_20080 [Solirubrobacteraceae bacterium]